jgi:pilus assembly protein CpaE
MEELLDAVNDLLTIRREPSAGAGSQIALFSLRGGVGVTTLAVNLATALATLDIGPVCLADLCPSGHAALQLGLRPQPSWADLLQADTLDADVLGEHLLHHTSGLHVLASPVTPLVEQGMDFNATQGLLALLRARFSTIVVDTPSWLGETTMAVLRAATFAGLVVTPEPAAIQAALGTLQALKAQDIGTHLIINQNRSEPQIPLGAMERILKQKPLIALPFDPAHPATLTQGRPLILQQPDAPFARAMRKLAQGIHQME